MANPGQKNAKLVGPDMKSGGHGPWVKGPVLTAGGLFQNNYIPLTSNY